MWGKSSKGYMDFALFKKIIDEGAAGGLYSIKCSFRGEPMLHQSLSDMVAYAKKKGIMDVYFNTNGTMFTDKNIRSLIEAGLDRISISIDGWDKASFERNRVGAKYEKVIEGILLLKRIREEMDSPFPQIRVQAVMLPDVKAHWAEYISFWKGMVDEIGYLDAREEGPQYDHRGQTGDFACPFLWQRMTILWDGTVMPCLMHGVEDFSLMKLGNVQETSIKELWHSQKLAGVRRLHQNFQSQKLEACDRCSYRASELKKVAISASATA
jgi:radical SAM protein with 4Fe4S-binding SPASM domain